LHSRAPPIKPEPAVSPPPKYSMSKDFPPEVAPAPVQRKRAARKNSNEASDEGDKVYIL
jgi:hypothetical protein